MILRLLIGIWTEKLGRTYFSYEICGVKAQSIMTKHRLHTLFSLVLTLLLTGAVGMVSAQRQITERPECYKEKGVASFYGTRFDGQLTASGDVFDSKGMTAASNTLPLDTYVKVTNLKNGKWIVVRVNDRMSKHNKRLIDLTKGAAQKLKFIQHGLTRVKVEFVPDEFYAFFGVAPEDLLLAVRLK